MATKLEVQQIQGHQADQSREKSRLLEAVRLRQGKMEPTRKCIAAITAACRELFRRRVRAADLFDLDGV